jgi:hypothetical protein
MNRAPAIQQSQSTSLRLRLEQRRLTGKPHTLKEAVGVVVPLAVELSQRHAAGQLVFVHPSSIVQDLDGTFTLSDAAARERPGDPRDRACLAPEQRDGRAGNARSSVFALGAILYELCTGESVGPGMRRPSEFLRTLPPALDEILSRALVGDAAHRPDDLKALAQAIHHLAPTGSIAPPNADESHLDHDRSTGFDVDLSMSLLPQAHADVDPYSVNVQSAVARVPGIDQATGALTELKQRLEADPRPRYVVVRDGMDHGPFNAVELLQQIASHTFTGEDVLRDSFTNDERRIADWSEFAPFADHANRHRVIAAEKVAIQQTAASEKRSTRGKAALGIIIIGALVIAGGTWLLIKGKTRSDDVDVQEETATNVEADGNLNVPGGAKGGKGRRVVGNQGGIPILGGGMSCEGAQAAYVEEMKIGGGKGQADITAAQYGSILNNGSYLNGCGLPSSMGVDVCVAVQAGRAVGVTVRTKPSRNAGVERCIAGRVRGISFPNHPKLDVTRTSF